MCKARTHSDSSSAMHKETHTDAQLNTQIRTYQRLVHLHGTWAMAMRETLSSCLIPALSWRSCAVRVSQASAARFFLPAVGSHWISSCLSTLFLSQHCILRSF